MPLISFKMPFPRVPVTFWLPTFGEPDSYGNQVPTYDDGNTITALASYTISDTADDIEDDRPLGDVLRVTLYLPKDFSADLRSAKCKIGTTDPFLASLTFRVIGVPTSYMREAVPGDMSTVVRLVEYVG